MCFSYYGLNIKIYSNNLNIFENHAEYRSNQVKLPIIHYSIPQMRKVRIPLATYILLKFILMEWFLAGFVRETRSR